MSYTVLMKRTGQIYSLSDEDAQDLIDQRFSNKRPFLVDLEGDQHQSSDIQSITKNPETKIADPFPTNMELLPKGKKCHSARSIQNEINQIIKSEHPRDWGKKIGVTTFREQIRQRLLASDPNGWCDYKSGNCVCE